MMILKTLSTNKTLSTDEDIKFKALSTAADI